MDEQRLLILLNKQKNDACSEEELAELEQWYGSLDTGNRPIDVTDDLVAEVLTQFRNRLAAEKRAIPLYRKRLLRIAAAAAILIAVCSAGYFLFVDRKGRKQEIVMFSDPAKDIKAPNATKAYITLSNGRKIILDSLQNGTVALEGSMRINKKGDQIVYSGSEMASTEPRLNTLTVPKGSKPVKLLLADGSELWLDAATTVTYPNAFVGKERRVEIITGQAYFEIAHNPSMPFIAKKGNAEVQVLGTHFNVSAFDGEAMKVTLLEGSVNVTAGNEPTKTFQSLVIKPGQQAVLTGNSQLSSRSAIDLDEVMAWKNGNFQFEGADITTVVSQLERWYDVDVEVLGNIKEHFGGTISRDKSVSQVFHMLQLTGEINYKIEGRKIIVTP